MLTHKEPIINKEDINDDFLLKLFITPKNELIKNGTTSWNFLKEKQPNIFEYLNNRFEDLNYTNSVVQEILFRIKTNISCAPLCDICKTNKCKFNCFSIGYYKTCSRKCGYQQQSKSIKNTALEKYGVTAYFKTDEFKEKSAKTCLKRYGVEYSFQSEEMKKKSTETFLKKYGSKRYIGSEEGKEKIRKTIRTRYGCDNAMQNEEIKEKTKATCLKKYGDSNVLGKNSSVRKKLNFKKINEKVFQTRKRNHTLNSSKIEKEILEWLNDFYKNYTVKTNFKTSLYPFKVDFYIEELDLYIEINAYYTHGTHPFDDKNEQDIKQLNALLEKEKTHIYKKKTKYVPSYVWSQYDVLKRETAKNNKLNYLEIFSGNADLCKNAIKDYIENGKKEYHFFMETRKLKESKNDGLV